MLLWLLVHGRISESNSLKLPQGKTNNEKNRVPLLSVHPGSRAGSAKDRWVQAPALILTWCFMYRAAQQNIGCYTIKQFRIQVNTGFRRFSRFFPPMDKTVVYSIFIGWVTLLTCPQNETVDVNHLLANEIGQIVTNNNNVYVFWKN